MEKNVTNRHQKWDKKNVLKTWPEKKRDISYPHFRGTLSFRIIYMLWYTQGIINAYLVRDRGCSTLISVCMYT